MAIHKQVRTLVTIDPTNNAKALRVENIGGGNVALTAVFSVGSETKAVLPWKELWKILFLKDNALRDFKADIKRVVKDVDFIVKGSNLRLFFTPNNNADLVCVATRDLKEALLAIR